ncbi:hypothetical protein KTAU_41250 [Thermogemmatispora aurantia]|uniref:methylation-associated defense system protein MAD7 n=1 Tax=Thermogemmatispora aurantia TaxID=2045279 RepID=UPI00124BE58F|nr:hypothetical protein [Thermogemmatispora aurantia]GER85490.1 hypothetical protein KTAU_41250 [Thermogemmatispora aurantia]
MKVKLPKELRGVRFSLVLPIELNDFDIELLLPILFFTILAEGRGRARIPNDPRTIDVYINKLSQHPALEGFTTPRERRLLERLVRTALITTGHTGRKREAEQITSIVTYSILSYKPGFPKEASRLRSADLFLYQAMHRYLKGDQALRQFLKEIFGRGVKLGKAGDLGGEYDGTTEVDTLTRLSLAFLDGFESARPGLSREKDAHPGACPGLTYELAADLVQYMSAYHRAMPMPAFIHHLLTLINFELFIYTLKVVYAVNALVAQPESLPPAMGEPPAPSPPTLYVDFTGQPGPSQEMAHACVRRDIEAYQSFLSANLLLRQLQSYVEQLRRNSRRRALIDGLLGGATTGPLYLQRLLMLRDQSSICADIQAQARDDTDKIFEENKDPEDPESKLAIKYLDELLASAESDLDGLVILLKEGQRDATQQFVKWYWSTGGLTRTEGLLRGQHKYRPSWQYAPTNDLLAVLVQLAAARLNDSENGLNGDQSNHGPMPIRLQDFLRFLDERFGLLVDRPPAPFVGAEYTAAAQENLRAMLRRLRQMGIFRDLSDDFTVQRLHPPYAATSALTSYY